MTSHKHTALTLDATPGALRRGARHLRAGGHVGDIPLADDDAADEEHDDEHDGGDDTEDEDSTEHFW